MSTPHVTERDLGYAAADERLRSITRQSVAAGLWSQAVNAYGERLLTVAFAQSGSRGAAVHWMKRANSAVLTRARATLGPETYDALVSGMAPAAIARTTGMAMQGALRGSVEGEDLVKTGALRDAMDFETPDHPHRTDFAVSRTRVKRSAGAYSSGQSLYRAYHKGRSASMLAFRNAVTYRAFKESHGKAWNASSKAERSILRRSVALRGREIAAAKRGTVARHQAHRDTKAGQRDAAIQAVAAAILSGRYS